LFEQIIKVDIDNSILSLNIQILSREFSSLTNSFVLKKYYDLLEISAFDQNVICTISSWQFYKFASFCHIQLLPNSNKITEQILQNICETLKKVDARSDSKSKYFSLNNNKTF